MRSNTTCPKCKGTGEIPLSDVLQATLGAVSIHGPITAPELYQYDDWNGVGISALNNRLEDLRKLGILDRKRSYRNKGFTYFIPRKQTKTK